MIFMQREREDKPVFTAYVNNVDEKIVNGETHTTYKLGTRDKKPDGKFIYSSWFCKLGRRAQEKCALDPLQKGDRVAVYSVKLTNTSAKKDDGTYGKSYLNVIVMDYDKVQSGSPAAPNPADGEISEEDLAY